jgi:very-short-patch-repair endonuclease
MVRDETRWQQLLREQEGVVSRGQALDHGWHRAAVGHRLGRSWQRLLPAVYLTTTGVPTWEQKAWAGVLLAGESAALTSWSGLAMWDLGDRVDDVHVALPHARQLSGGAFLAGGGRLVVHRTTRSLESRGSLPTLPVERCVVDACLGLRLLDDVRAVVSRSVQRGRTTVDKLLVALDEAPQRGSALLRRALDEVAEGARSAHEATLARALRRASLPPYRLNADVHDEHGVWLARGDVVIEEVRLLVEVDGARWHLSAERWVADVERHTRLEAAGWTVLRYPASRVLRDAVGVVAEVEAVAARLRTRAAS